jgi:hypothetical protein
VPYSQPRMSILDRFLTPLYSIVFSVHTKTGARIGEVGFGRIRNALAKG